MGKKPTICYLCGKEITADRSKDHVPPKQFFPRSLRPKSGQLLTIPCHKSCNARYHKDEDYLVHSLGPVAMKTPSGRHLWEDIKKKFKTANGKRMGEKVLQEFDPKPGGIALPHDRIAKRFDARVWRVVWKIVRGLFFHSAGRFLPEDIPPMHEISDIEEEPSELLKHLDLKKQQGQAPGIFAWKHLEYTDGVAHFHIIGLLLWDKIVMVTGFHDPDCKCEICTKRLSP